MIEYEKNGELAFFGNESRDYIHLTLQKDIANRQ